MRRRLLHITNGDCAGDTLTCSTVPGDVLAWRDNLHDGPVHGDSLRDVSAVRVRWHGAVHGFDKVRRDFDERDTQLERCGDYDEIVLWFEQDLYDQLQLLQLLDWFATHPLAASRLSLICIDRFPGAEPFHGLGQLAPAQLETLFGSEQPVTSAQLQLGQRGWCAFRHRDPALLEQLRQQDLMPLPFLERALCRFLEEYPWIGDGLSRNARQILQLVGSGIDAPDRLFTASQQLEEAVYLGDWSFFSYIADLCNSRVPALACQPHGRFCHPLETSADVFKNQRLQLTEIGHQLLAGEVDWIALNSIDTWRGGVQLTRAHVWRWNPLTQRLQPDASDHA